MDAIEVLRMAKDSLFSNRVRSVLTMLGVIIGVSDASSFIPSLNGGRATC